jgi:tRNA G26 N,N-dimethylase Trm1
VSRAGKLAGTPQKAPLLAALQAAGHVAAAVHLDAKAVRTTASMAQVVAIARQLS